MAVTPKKRLSDSFHQQLGYCIAKWARVEDRLFNICWAALQCPTKAAAIVYYRTPTLDARLTLTDELVHLVLPPYEAGQHPSEEEKAWKAIVAEMRGLLPIRNRLAHHPVSDRGLAIYSAFNQVGGIKVEPEEGYLWYESYVSESEQLRGRDDKTEPLTIGELKTHFAKTGGLIMKMDRFWNEMLLTLVPKRP